MKKNFVWNVVVILSSTLFIYGCSGDMNGGNSSKNEYPLRVLAKNVLFRTAVANAATSKASVSNVDVANEVDVNTKVLAENVIYTNDSGQGDIAADNVEDALTETNVALDKSIVGRWNVTNIGQNKSGVVIFQSDGTYIIESGYFEGGGSWTNVSNGTYFINGDVIAFKYAGWDTSTFPVSRFALVVYKRPDTLTIAIQGHTHGIEQLDKIAQ